MQGPCYRKQNSACWGGCWGGTHRPELNEILQHSGGDEEAVHKRIRQKKDEELVVGETHTIVDPGE